MSNFLQLETQVRSLLDEPDPSGFFTTQEIRDWLNQGQLRVTERVKHLRKEERGYTTGDQKYLLPEDLMEIYQVKLNGQTVSRISLEDLGRRTGYLLWEGGNIYISPDAPGTYLEIFYYRMPVKMEGDLSVPEIPAEFEDLLINYALTKAKTRDNKLDEAQYFEAKFNEGVKDMFRRYQKATPKRNQFIIGR